MTFPDLLQTLSATVVHEGRDFHSARIEHVMASDLMSDVLVVDESRLLLVTSLASDQAIRTADIVGALGVVVVNGKTLPLSMKNVAQTLNITLLQSPLKKFEVCVKIGKILSSL